ncbi:TetR/AcrR family transcriptional regulator [Streptomyces sp. N2-109]|uniref:TetR/AcrR family transcriptional regulator n=1 Tax=Streptomyces gossypii TaxID=2883101 RepID=A0ABT2JYB0_9ACTN|nr:TetR/AcrR family transcriptional regulator [Streptomyces gossypii]MCT2592882.1 TetR/AcrR family transcriptional regulator [Streptomyces gossypii]
MATPPRSTAFPAEQPQPARRPGGRSARIRAQVLDAVRAQLVEHGYDELTVDAVAARAGVHRTTVYRRWREVGGLLADVLDAAADDDWQPPDTGSLAGDLTAMNREVHTALTTGPPLTTALIAASFRSAEAADALGRFWEDRYGRCEAVVSRATRRGEIPEHTDARRLLIAATAPLFHQLLLLRTAPDLPLAEQTARDAASAAAVGTYAGPPTSSPG